MDRARAAQRTTATELGAGHTEDVAHYPQHRRVVVDIDAVCLPIDCDGEGHDGLSPFCQRHKKRRWDQTRRAKVNLLDDGIGRYVGISRRGNRAARGPRPRHQGMMDARMRNGASSVDDVMASWLGTN